MFIKLQDVNKSYGKSPNEVKVLKNINLALNQGEMTAIMGKSGCGKSTLINVLGGLTQISSGKYFFCDKEISFSKKNDLSKFRFENIGYIVQNFALINNKTAYQNIELPLLSTNIKESKKLIYHYAEMLGIRDKLNRFPYELSGGECQRVAIARALINNPKVILADEPTGSLDSTNEQIILDILSKIANNGTTVLIVTHDDSVAEHCNRIIHMKDGEVVL